MRTKNPANWLKRFVIKMIKFIANVKVATFNYWGKKKEEEESPLRFVRYASTSIAILYLIDHSKEFMFNGLKKRRIKLQDLELKRSVKVIFRDQLQK